MAFLQHSMPSKPNIAFLFFAIVCTLNSSGQTKFESFVWKSDEAVSYNYYLKKPASKSENKPLVVYLHGSGERGSDIEKVFINSPIGYLERQYPDCYILAPQCPNNQYWNAEALTKLVEFVLAKNAINKQQIFLIGVSMGAWASWNILINNPDLFTAAATISGYVDRIPMLEFQKLANTPIYMYHGTDDTVVPYWYSETLYQKLKQVNSTVKLHSEPNVGHGGWDTLFQNNEFYSWLLNQKKHK